MKSALQRMGIIALLGIFGFAACQPQTESPSEPPPVVDRTDDGPVRIDEGDENVNDSNELGDPASAGEDEADEVQAACPAPRQTEDICAQVIVWARGPQGQCCEYPTPCHAPENWMTFTSRDECRAQE